MRNRSGSLQILGGSVSHTVLTLKCPQCSRTWETLDVTMQMLDKCYPCSSCTSKDPMKMIKMWIPRVVNCVILKMKVLPLDIFKDSFYIQGRSILPFSQMGIFLDLRRRQALPGKRAEVADFYASVHNPDQYIMKVGQQSTSIDVPGHKRNANESRLETPSVKTDGPTARKMNEKSHKIKTLVIGNFPEDFTDSIGDEKSVFKISGSELAQFFNTHFKKNADEHLYSAEFFDTVILKIEPSWFFSVDESPIFDERGSLFDEKTFPFVASEIKNFVIYAIDIFRMTDKNVKAKVIYIDNKFDRSEFCSMLMKNVYTKNKKYKCSFEFYDDNKFN